MNCIFEEEIEVKLACDEADVEDDSALFEAPPPN
jgi:hypothetical protein